MYDNLLLNQEYGALTVTLNRPDKLNAFVGRMRRDLAEVLERAATDAAVRCVVITGAGRAFCAGGDIAYMAELIANDDAEEFGRLLGAARRVLHAIREMPKPVLASINGPAAGAGLNLALACDMRIASDKATLSQSFAKIGLHPDWGGTYFLPRLVPANIACEMFFLGDALTAERAYQLGLVNRVAPCEMLESETRALAQRLSQAPPISLGGSKQAVYQTEQATLDAMLDYELEAQLRCFRSQDMKEGLRAFLEKRAPKFTGQ